MLISNNDGFIWKKITQKQAEVIFANNLFDLYIVQSDFKEIPIETVKNLLIAFEEKSDVCIQVGHIII